MKLMDWFGPLMSLWIAFIAPAALGLYWIFNTVLGVLQQFILYKAMPLPVFTEEDYKAAEAELKGKAPYGKEQSFAEAMPERSLYLEDFDEDEMPAPVTEEEDDDDDDPPRAAKPKRKKPTSAEPDDFDREYGQPARPAKLKPKRVNVKAREFNPPDVAEDELADYEPAATKKTKRRGHGADI